MATAPGYPLMHGAQFAKKYVNDYLKVDIPVRIVDYQNGWNVDNASLPTPVQFLIHEPIGLDEWPTVITVAIAATDFSRIGFDGPDPLYRVTYQMRTYVWVKTEGEEAATVMRDRLTTIVRAALMDYPCLKAYDERGSFRLMIDEGSIREEYSELTLLKGDRVMAGSYVSYNLQIDEVISRKPIGILSEIQIDIVPAGVSASLDVSGSVTSPEIVVS
jgi:hypothetical protein